MTARILMGDESDEFNSMSGAMYRDDRRGSYGFTTIEVLPFLKGRRWDRLALAWVHGLRPSCIRVSDGAVHTDAFTWRVTVYIDPDTRRIERVTQEIEVALFRQFQNGHDLRVKTAQSAGQNVTDGGEFMIHAPRNGRGIAPEIYKVQTP